MQPKERAAETWHANWYNFYPLVERPNRPLCWSQNSVIFTASLTQPIITGRHFSSSRTFVLPSPSPVLSSPVSYESPSIITVAAGDEWLFAYFPRYDGDGTGCLWKRGPQIDSWAVKEFWSFTNGGGVVAASWLGSPREWANSAPSNLMRLPPRGPRTLISNPTLVLVTQDHHVHITYLRQYASSLVTMKRLLTSYGVTKEQPHATDVAENTRNNRQCIQAAIGLGYDETYIFIATYSRRLPAPLKITVPAVTPFNSMDLSVSVDVLQHEAQGPNPSDWETSGEDRCIELSEVQILFDGSIMGLYVNPIQPLEYTGSCLTNLVFICCPSLSGSTPPDSVLSPSLRKTNRPEKGKTYLAVTSVNFHDYVKQTTSQVSLYSLSQKPPIAGNNRVLWASHREGTRMFDTEVVSFVEPFTDLSAPNGVLIYVGVLHSSGSLVKGQPQVKEAFIGAVKVLNISDLCDNTSFEPTAIICPLGDLPLFAALSPNRALLCTISSSLLYTQTAIYSLPKRILEPDVPSSYHISVSLCKAILGKISTADLIHLICSPNMSQTELVETLYQALELLEKYKSESASSWDIMGLAIEAYRKKVAGSKVENEVELLQTRWQTAHDLCSLVACNIIFQDCQEGEGYDLNIVWPLIKTCTWVINFTEKLMKMCVLSSNAAIGKKEMPQISQTDDQTLNSPILLHLAHPFTLQNFITALKHVKEFRAFLGSLPAGGENSQIAKEVLVDLVDCSGVDLTGLISALEEVLERVQSFDPQQCRKALASCQPTEAMQHDLIQSIQMITQSPTILNKATLFIKPFDLVDGVSRLSIGSQRKETESDVVTKGVLFSRGSTDICLRCGGVTEVVKDALSQATSIKLPSRWRTWEKMWMLRCICGGSWLTPSAI